MYGIYRKKDNACFAKIAKPLEAQTFLKSIETAYPKEWFEMRVWRGEELVGEALRVKSKGRAK